MGIFGKRQTNALAKLVAPNALLGNALPQPTLDQELRSLIFRFGSDAVRDGAKRLTKKRKGRKQERDWAELSDTISQDSQDYLDGKNPFKERSNYSIAVEFAKRNPGHNSVATQRRIMRKLSERRHIYFLLRAWEFSEENRPFGDYFRIAEEFSAVDEKWGTNVLTWSDHRRGQLARYRETIGEPPPLMTLPDIDRALAEFAAAKYAQPAPLVGGFLSGFLALTPDKTDGVKIDGEKNMPK